MTTPAKDPSGWVTRRLSTISGSPASPCGNGVIIRPCAPSCMRAVKMARSVSLRGAGGSDDNESKSAVPVSSRMRTRPKWRAASDPSNSRARRIWVSGDTWSRSGSPSAAVRNERSNTSTLRATSRSSASEMFSACCNACCQAACRACQSMKPATPARLIAIAMASGTMWSRDVRMPGLLGSTRGWQDAPPFWGLKASPCPSVRRVAAARPISMREKV